jgi:putative ABC transport system permease protein
MRDIMRDLRHGLRMLAANPGYTATALGTLIMGIGASTAIFSVVNAVLLRPLPYPDPDRIAAIWGVSAQGSRSSLSESTFLEYRDHTHAFESLATYNGAGFTFTNVRNPERIRGARVSAAFFDVLRVRPLLGRTFQPGEDTEGRDTTVILGYGLWQRRFGADPTIVGQTISMNTRPYTVIGVLPPDFEFSVPGIFRPAELWTPAALSRANDATRRGNYLRVIARLQPGATLAQAQADLDAMNAAIQREHPETEAGLRSRTLRLHDQIVGDVRTVLWILFGAVGFVLLIACANVANLQLARASVRQKELVVRVALGASRARIVRQLLTESLLLALIAGALGTLVALWGISLLISLAPSGMPRWHGFEIDRVVLAYALGASLLTGVLFGLVPALSASSPRLSETLKDGGRTSIESARGTRFRAGLTIAEVALSVVLLTGAGLLIRSFVQLLDVNPGFDTEHTVMVPIGLPDYAYPDAERQAAFFQRAIDAARHLPGVDVAGAIDDLPLTGDRDASFITIANRPPLPRNQLPTAQIRSVSQQYFQTMVIPIVAGRGFDDRDTRTSPRVALINQTTARRLFPNENPIGQRLTLGAATPDSQWLTIVGVVGDVRDLELHEQANLEVYQAYTQATISFMTVVARTTGNGNPSALVAPLRDAIHQLDPALPLFEGQSMASVISFNLASRRFNMLLLGTLAAIALLLANVGIYGVIAYGVLRRRREIGVRIALGAQRRDVLTMVLRQGLTLTAIGIGVGLGASLLLTRFLATLLYSVRPGDPMTFAAVSAVLAGVALLASYLPARRAMRVDPTIALRQD